MAREILLEVAPRNGMDGRAVTHSKTWPVKKWLAVAFKFAVSVTLVWYVLERAGLGAVKDRVLGVAPIMVLLATVLLLVQALICTRRWQAVLDAIRTPLRFLHALALLFIGAFFNQTLPSSVGGDAVRIYKAHRAGLTLGGAFNGVILERVATVLGMVVLVVATQPVFLTRVGEDVGAWMMVALALFTLAAVAGIALLMVLDRLPSRLDRWRVVRGLAQLAADTRRLFLVPRHTVRALAWAVVGHVNVALAVYVLAVGLDIPVTWIDCMAIVPPVLLITTIPISIGGWGVREFTMVPAFGLIGVSQDSATALSVLLGLVIIVTALPGGVVWLTSADRRIAADGAIAGTSAGRP